MSTADAPDHGRLATDRLLTDLRLGRWRPHAWRRFMLDATQRSVRQAAAHPRALVEASALHGIFLLSARRRRTSVVWVATSWTLTVLHLGSLGQRRGLGAANMVTLTRANLPAITNQLRRSCAALALGTDFVDGRLARRANIETRFGLYADPLADAAYWYAHTRTDRLGRWAVILVWLVPAIAVTARSIVHGRMLDPPRRALIRPAAALQVVLTVRTFGSLRRPTSG